MSFIKGLSLELRSHDQFKASHWSTRIILCTTLSFKLYFNGTVL